MAGKFNLAEHIQAAQPLTSRDIEAITTDILAAKQRTVEDILAIGRGLIEAKAVLSHGEWLPWLTERVDFTEWTAANYMKLARRFSNLESITNLGYTKALALLALPENAVDEFLEVPHVVDGEEKTVSEMSVRELKTAIRERDEALRAAEQAKADQSAAEQAREQMARDMDFANKRIAGLSAEVEQKTVEVRERAAEAARLEKELAELRSRPVDVAVEVDAAAVEAARKEAEERMQVQLDEAKQALAQAKAEARAIREQAERAEKKASIAANEDLVLFSTLFDQVQEQVNKLGGVLIKTRNKNPDAAGPLQNALLALADKIKGVAEG